MAQNRNNLIVLSLGTVLEWAEYTFYGYMALTLSALFFPSEAPHIGILKTFGVFAVGYIMRPLGALIFGYIGDRLGRRPALLGSLLLMGFATFSMGCLPTYEIIGPACAWFLLLLRMLQGLAVAGEYNGAGIYAVETAPSKPAFAGSWISASAAGGMVVGGLAAFCISQPFAPTWAWRLPFLLGGFSCFIGLWLRKSALESTTIRTQKKMPLWEILQNYKREFLVVSTIAAFTGIFVYIGNIYIVVFLKTIAHVSTSHATLFAIFGELIVMICIPIMGYISDHGCPYKQYRMGLIGIALGAPLIFLLSATGQYGYILIAMILYGVLNGIVCGPMVKILFDQFPYALRYTGVSFAWSIAAALFSGTAPAVAQCLTTYSSTIIAPSLYVSIMALLTYFVLNLKPHPSKTQVDRLNTLDLTY